MIVVAGQVRPFLDDIAERRPGLVEHNLNLTIVERAPPSRQQRSDELGGRTAPPSSKPLAIARSLAPFAVLDERGPAKKGFFRRAAPRTPRRQARSLQARPD